MKKILIINGPNLNTLGRRQPEIYGRDTLEDIISWTESKLEKYEVELEWFQSNHEGEIIDKIQSTLDKDYSALVINPGAYSHTSVAILDAMHCVEIPIIEVHLSNTHAREDFRKVRLTAQAANTIIEGLGKTVYYHAILTQVDS